MKKYTSLSLSRYLSELSSAKPVPGGGSASAYVACLAMGLAEMVARVGMKKLNRNSRRAVRMAIRLFQKTKKNALQVVDLDPQVYQSVLRSYAKARSLPEGKAKSRVVDQALENSFRLQRDLALLVTMAKRSAESLERMIPGSIRSDLEISLGLLEAAFRGAYETARINMVYLKDPQKKTRAQQALRELKRRFETPDASRN